MLRGEAWFLHASVFAVGVSGVLYAIVLYLVEPADEFALANHASQPHLLHAHVLTAPLFVFGCALIWRSHIWQRFSSGAKQRRASGLPLFLVLGPMVLSGYLLQVVDAEWAISAARVVHVATSLVFLPIYLLHQLAGVAHRRRAT